MQTFKMPTFKDGDHAMCKVKGEYVSVVIQHCSYFCPEFVKEDGTVQPEQSFYTVRLDGDVGPTVPNFEDHCQPIHKVALDQLMPYVVSPKYETNKGLWDLKTAALEAMQKATQTCAKYEQAAERVAKYGRILPGKRLLWYEYDYPCKASSAIVTAVDFIAGYCTVEGGHSVPLNTNIFSCTD
jgi:hypothetical protein